MMLAAVMLPGVDAAALYADVIAAERIDSDWSR